MGQIFAKQKREENIVKKGLGTIILVFAFLVTYSDGLRGEDFEVSTALELQDALTTARSNGQSDVIKVAQGTYLGTFAYDAAATETYFIWLSGGWTPDFTSQVLDPSNTILDAEGGGCVLFINSEGTAGDIRIEGFTIRNGYTPGLGGGIYAYTDRETGESGNINIDHCIITGNEATTGGGGVYASSRGWGASSGDISITHNTITENASGGLGVGASIDTYAVPAGISDIVQAGDIYFAFNTVTGNNSEGSWAVYLNNIGFGLGQRSGRTEFINNLITGNTNGGAWLHNDGEDGSVTCTNNTIADNTVYGLNIFSEDGVPVHAFNNIMWDNWNENERNYHDLDITMLSMPGETVEANGFNNDYGIMFAWGELTDWTDEANNLRQDPRFVGGGDYYFRPESPCIDSGDDSAPSRPAEDIAGNPRILDGDKDGTAVVDMGAFEQDYLALFTDIKPGTCPNPLYPPSWEGVLPVTICGTADFGVDWIDPESIKLEGVVSPLPESDEIKDVATPFLGELCDCHEVKEDGYLDLTLLFNTPELVAALGQINYGDVITLTLTGYLKEEYGGTKILGQDCVVIRTNSVFTDIKPGGCPNMINTRSKGRLSVAICGTEYFDVTTIDPASLSIDGTIAPLRWDYEDQATPFEGEICDCHEVEGDGYIDLVLQFETQELVAFLGEINDGDVITLTFTGYLKEEYGGTEILGRDCIVIRMR